MNCNEISTIFVKRDDIHFDPIQIINKWANGRVSYIHTHRKPVGEQLGDPESCHVDHVICLSPQVTFSPCYPTRLYAWTGSRKRGPLVHDRPIS